MSFGKPPSDNKDAGGITAAPPSRITTAGGAGGVEAFLGQGSKVTGTLTFTGPVEIDGNVEGEIRAQERLVIGEAAVINAKIHGSEVLVMGTVNGDIIASKKLSLRKPAKVIGNITCSVLSIEEGVTLEGRCSMDASAGAASVKGDMKNTAAAPKPAAAASA